MKSRDKEVLDKQDTYRNENSSYNVLPSYQMYKDIVGKNLNPHTEVYQLHHEPPTYNSSSSGSSIMSNGSVDSASVNSSTVLDNLDSLKLFSDSVKQNIYLTKGGVEGELVPDDEKAIEYVQGDLVKGHIIIENPTAKPIPFNMYYVVLEGTFHQEHKTTNFLQMVDFEASQNYDVEEDKVDPVDGSYLTLGHTLLPQKRYKRFFKFKVPQKLLDCDCSRRLPRHLQIPPSCGRNSKDFFRTSSIRYNVRSVLVHTKDNDYYRLSDTTRLIRITPRYSDIACPRNDYVDVICKRLMDEFDDLGYEKNSKVKCKFLELIHKLNKIPFDPHASTTLSNKPITLHIPKTDLRINHYSPLLRGDSLRSLDVRIDIIAHSQPFPTIKKILAELVALTIESPKLPIPIDIDHSMLFVNETNADFHLLLVDPSRRLFNEMRRLRKHHPQFPDDPQLLADLMCLGTLSDSYTELSIDNILTSERVGTQPGSCKSLTLHLDLNSMYLKGLDRAVKSNRFNNLFLLPNFQCCQLVRMYYLRVTIHVNNRNFLFYLPLSIE